MAPSDLRMVLSTGQDGRKQAMSLAMWEQDIRREGDKTVTQAHHTRLQRSLVGLSCLCYSVVIFSLQSWFQFLWVPTPPPFFPDFVFLEQKLSIYDDEIFWGAGTASCGNLLYPLPLPHILFFGVVGFWTALPRIQPCWVFVCEFLCRCITLFGLSFDDWYAYLHLLCALVNSSMCLCGCRLTDNLPCSTKIMLKNNEIQHEHGYRLGAVIDNKVSICICILFMKVCFGVFHDRLKELSANWAWTD